MAIDRNWANWFWSNWVLSFWKYVILKSSFESWVNSAPSFSLLWDFSVINSNWYLTFSSWDSQWLLLILFLILSSISWVLLESSTSTASLDSQLVRGSGLLLAFANSSSSYSSVSEGEQPIGDGFMIASALSLYFISCSISTTVFDSCSSILYDKLGSIGAIIWGSAVACSSTFITTS